MTPPEPSEALCAGARPAAEPRHTTALRAIGCTGFAVALVVLLFTWAVVWLWIALGSLIGTALIDSVWTDVDRMRR